MNKRILLDECIWLVSAVVCVLWRLTAEKTEIWGYIGLFAAMMVVWLVVGWMLRLYRSYKQVHFGQAILSLLGTSGVCFLLIYMVLPCLPVSFSPVIANWMVGIVASIDFVVIMIEHYWKYALHMSETPIVIEQRDRVLLRRADECRSAASIATIHSSICSLTTEEDYSMLRTKARLDRRLTKVVADKELFSIMQLPDYEYDTIVDMTLLNEALGINKRFCMVNKKLPDEGRYVCCYRPQEYIKQKILGRYPKGINYLFYMIYFLWKRVVPRLVLMSRLYYDLTKGRKRMLSKTEVLGRLYYCGFEVDEIVPMGHIEYIFAHRHSQPYPQEQVKVYGPLIKLRRVGQNREYIYMYKFRTMHPYAEYIQKYVFEQRGGMDIADKSNEDFRITSWGRFLRKYWLDELPMLLNWLRGDVKLVGVRPISQAMFDTYPADLQDKRTRCKPGLIPPFYIDHPKTYEELFASENAYLDAYFKHPIRTDMVYFFRTIYAIVFKKMRSA